LKKKRINDIVETIFVLLEVRPEVARKTLITTFEGAAQLVEKDKSTSLLLWRLTGRATGKKRKYPLQSLFIYPSLQ
jgi:hypothetical protein